MVLTFQATVSSRSSKATPGPPGEAKVIMLNPQRRERILQEMAWTQLAQGTLNVEVAEDVVHRLLLCEPIIREDGTTVKYPEEYKSIPLRRIGYLYYQASTKGRASGTGLDQTGMQPP